MLTEEDVNNYTIDDVVYPLPGKLSVYPENEMKDLYKQILGTIWTINFLVDKLTNISTIAEDGISMESKHKHFEWVL